MALLFIDGFDHYGTNDFFRKWSNGQILSVSSTLGRRGGGGVIRPECYKNLSTNYSTLIAGLAVYLSEFLVGLPHVIVTFSQGSTRLVTLAATSAGEIAVWNSSGNIIGRTKPGLISLATWAYVEVKAVTGTTTGAIEVRVNGVSELVLTNVNTSSSTFTSVGFSGISNTAVMGGNSRVDDLYVIDTSGTSNNDFLGDCRVDAYMPTSEGPTQSWTPTPAGVHYTTVDEIPINSADYVESATAGAVELFGYTDLVNIPLNIFGVQVNSAARKTDAGSRYINSAARIGGTDYVSANLAVSDTTTYLHSIWDKSPATSAAWTRAEINGTDFGVKLV
jgi:hypothetical protein